MGRQSVVIVLFLALVDTGSSQQSAPPSKKSDRALLQEEMEDYYKKWLKQDVVYIISDEEKGVFDRLNSDDEREQFIEQFWMRRDSDAQTKLQRVQGKNITVGLPTPMTIFSVPRQGGERIEAGPISCGARPMTGRCAPSAGRYERLPHEGGGTTVTYAFRALALSSYPRNRVRTSSWNSWISPVPQSNRLALGLEEKDALLHTDAGLTWAEESGMMDKSQRPYFTPGSANNPLIQGHDAHAVKRPAVCSDGPLFCCSEGS